MYTAERRTQIEEQFLKMSWRMNDCNLYMKDDSWYGNIFFLFEEWYSGSISAFRSADDEVQQDTCCGPTDGLTVPKVIKKSEWTYKITFSNVSWDTKNPQIIAKINELVQTKLWDQSNALMNLLNGTA